MSSKRPRDKEYKGNVLKLLKAQLRRAESNVFGNSGDTCTLGSVVRQPKRRHRVHV